MRSPGARFLAACLVSVAFGCGGETARPGAEAGSARSLLLITIDTLRADRVGAYGHAGARTPVLDSVAREGVRFDRAFATAPITLTSHASLLTGRYPPGHGARHNGIGMRAVPTLATILQPRGFATAAFVAAFPFDRRFGLSRGFGTYSDHLPRGMTAGRSTSGPASVVADEAIAWLNRQRLRPRSSRGCTSSSRTLRTAPRRSADLAPAARAIRRRGGGSGPEAGRVIAALGPTRRLDARGDRRRPRRVVRRARRDRPQRLRLRHDAAGAAADEGPGLAARPRSWPSRCRSWTSRRPRCAALGVSPPPTWTASTSGPGPAPGRGPRGCSTPSRSRRSSIRLEPAADGAVGAMEVHRRAEARAVRPPPRPGRDGYVSASHADVTAQARGPSGWHQRPRASRRRRPRRPGWTPRPARACRRSGTSAARADRRRARAGRPEGPQARSRAASRSSCPREVQGAALERRVAVDPRRRRRQPQAHLRLGYVLLGTGRAGKPGATCQATARYRAW